MQSKNKINPIIQPVKKVSPKKITKPDEKKYNKPKDTQKKNEPIKQELDNKPEKSKHDDNINKTSYTLQEFSENCKNSSHITTPNFIKKDMPILTGLSNFILWFKKLGSK